MTVARPLKAVFWLGNTKQVLTALSKDVREEFGHALFEAQKGGRHISAKPLSGYGDAGVIEVVCDDRGDTFRAVYTVRWPTGIYVLHVFQKKSKSGSKTPKQKMNLIENRLKRLKEIHEQAAKQEKDRKL